MRPSTARAARRRLPALAALALLAPLAVAEADAGTVDLATANRLVDGYARHVLTRLPRAWREEQERRLRDDPPRIDADGVFQIMAPAGLVAFEYDAAGQRLHCDAVIQKVRQECTRFGLCREEILAVLERAAAAGLDTGGGELFWDPVAEGFFLRRTYSEPPRSLRRMARELDRLMAAGERWFRRHYLAAILDHVERLAPPESAIGQNGDFEVTIVLTPDLRYQDLWRGPGPRPQPRVISRREFARGDEVWALALFSGGGMETDGELRLEAQYVFVYPDGSEHGSPVGNLWWSEPPPPDRLQMSELRAAIELDEDAPLGDYRVRIQVCEPTLVRCVTAETPFRVRAGDPR